jgi:nucleoside-diphosphate-sugar epimerase
MSHSDQRILVLGGTSFIGRSFCETIRDKHRSPFVLLNRGITNPDLFPGIPRIHCDRNSDAECKTRLSGTSWDAIVDFTGQEDHQIRNIMSNCQCAHYTFFSSSTVDLSWPADSLFSMAQNKLWCENLLQRFVKNVLIVRPGFVCGQHDYTGRFEEADGMWYWKDTKNPVFPMVRVELLSNLVARLVKERRTGLVRAGYNVPTQT